MARVSKNNGDIEDVKTSDGVEGIRNGGGIGTIRNYDTGGGALRSELRRSPGTIQTPVHKVIA